MFHDEGASTAVTGSEVLFIASMTPEKGSRTSPVKLKPWRRLSSVSRDEYAKPKEVLFGVASSTKDGIQHVVGLLQGRREIFRECYVEIFELGG